MKLQGRNMMQPGSVSKKFAPETAGVILNHVYSFKKSYADWELVSQS